MLDSSSNVSLSTKIIDKVLKLFEIVATTSTMWASKWAVQKKALCVHEVDVYSALSTKIDSLFYKVESISQLTIIA